MAFLTKYPMPTETVELMKQFGFHQKNALAPSVEWNNLKGLIISHHYSEYPRSVDDIFNMVHVAGYNRGVYDQMNKYSNSVKSLIDNFVNENRVISKVPHRADQNLLLQDLGQCAA